MIVGKMAGVVTTEDIKREIDRVPLEKLEGLYRYIRSLAEIHPEKQSMETFIERMNRIRIDAPADFATDIDEYLYGGKTID